VNILITFPTRSRPQKFLETLELWEHPEVKIAITIDRDDATMNNAQMLADLRERGHDVQIMSPQGKIAAMNYGVKERDWDLLFVAQDDLEPRRRYVQETLRLWDKHFGESTDGVLHLNDGFRHDYLNTIVIIGRQYFDRFGYIYHPQYRSLFADNEYTDVSTHLRRVVRISKRIIVHEWAGMSPDALLIRNERFYDEDRATYFRRKAMGFPLEPVPA